MIGIGADVESVGVLVGRQLLARGLISRGSSVVLVNISADVSRPDANYLKLHRL